MGGVELHSNNQISIVAPLGISFFTLQALSYVFEVYKHKVSAERNLIRYAVYVTFFPTIMSGPIERPELLRQIQRPDSGKIQFKNIKSGILFVMYGGFVKYVAADRLAIVADTVFDKPYSYGMTALVFGMVCYTLQIYCDFFSYSLMALGLGRMLGISLTENFKAPYLSCSVKEFWRRWHISLSTWFRDYVYIPLGGNRCSALRKSFNLFVTFLVSGIWHGASWTYIVWGCLHGIYQILGDRTARLRKGLYRRFSVKTDCFSFRLGQRLCTFGLVSVAWVFFRSDTLSDAFFYIARMIGKFDLWNLFNDSIYRLGLDALQMRILFVALFIIAALDLVKYRTDKNIDSLLSEQNWGFQGLFYIFLFIATLIFGMYGPAYHAQEFIYFQF